MNRRSLLSRAALLGAAATLRPLPVLAEAASPAQPHFCLFTKHLIGMEPAALAEHVAALGFQGIEAPIRPGGHVLPEEVADKLPGFVETLTNQIGCDSIVTTTVALLPSDTTAVFTTNCDPAQTGVFTNILTAQNGCDSTVTVSVTTAP